VFEVLDLKGFKLSGGRMFKKESKETILEWIKSPRLDQFGKYLVSSTVHGKPGIPLAELSNVHKILKENLTDEELYKLGKELLKRPEYTARRMGVSLITVGWPKHKEVERLVIETADDEDWQVRETAAGVFAVLLEKDFSHFSKVFQKVTVKGSVNVKRAIAVAVKYDSKSEDAKKWKTYLNLIDPLMSEEDEYIRKNLGPFAIGDGLLSRFPKQTIEASLRWAESSDENVKWNTAMIFTAAAAKKFPKEGKKILSGLVKDESSFVVKAAKKAMKNLGIQA